MSMFWEFFTFELRFGAKSPSTYIYFMLWVAFAFLSVAAENFGPVANSNGKVLLNGPYGITFGDQAACLFGLIIIAAIFGTSILRDFQRDTYQILFTKPVSKFAYLGGRWAGSFVTTVLVFSGLMIGTYFGTLAPWADHTRIGPNHLSWYLEPFLSIVVIQIFFTGALFFAVAALTRKIFIVYLQGVALFMAYVIGVTAFSTTRSLEHFWSGILDPVGLLLNSAVSRYWSVVRKTPCSSPGIFPDTRRAYFYITGCFGSMSAWRPWLPPGRCSRCQWRRSRPAHKASARRARARTRNRAWRKSVLLSPCNCPDPFKCSVRAWPFGNISPSRP